MSNVGFAVRDSAGNLRYGNFTGGETSEAYVGLSKDISLNLSASDVAGYSRVGKDLHVVLANGETLVLKGYFIDIQAGEKQLFLSENGQLVEVQLEDGEGDLAASYTSVNVGDKWSAYDELVFLDVERIEPVVAPLIAPAFSGLGAALGIGGAALVGTEVLGGSGSGGGGVVTPTVDDADIDRIVGGTADGDVTVTGTGAPGSEVTVTIGGQSQTVIIGDDGTWSVNFAQGDLPADGVYQAVVVVVDPDGNSFTLDGPSIDIDLTAPDVDVLAGTQSVGDLVNGDDYDAGAVISGQGEAGATVQVTIGGVSHSTVVGDDGSWSVAYASGELAEGEYSSEVTITTTDPRGNVTVVTDTLVVDTVAPDAVPNTVAGDDVINAAERSSGVPITGTGEPGAVIVVEMQGVTQTTTVSDAGTWTVNFASGSIAEGTYDSVVTVTSTDAAGNSAVTTHTVQIDTENTVGIDSGLAGGDDILNAAEAQSALAITGTGEPGSTVDVTVAGVTRSAVVGDDGTWSAVFEAGSLPTGEFDATITAVSTDAAGNVTSASSALAVDTVAGDVALSALPIEIDDTINAVERADGVDISGTATPGMTVTVGLGTATTQVVADPSGNWTATFDAADIPTGTSTLPITASITDAAGNSASVSDTVALDTQVENFAQSGGAIEGDDLINSTERADGVTLTGTVEPGSTVSVQMGAVTRQASVDAAGNWSVDFAATDIPTGTYDGTLTVTATDAAGNVSVLNDSYSVDTDVDNFAVASAQTADDTINAAELASGVTLTGTVEPGSTVFVEVSGVTQAADVDVNGNWTVTYDAGSLPEGTYEATATVTATDLAGNTETLQDTFQVDTEVDTPEIDSVTFSGQDVRRFSTDNSADTYTVNTLESNGTVGDPTYAQDSDPVFGTEFTFAAPVSDGTHLVVSSSDAAGNSSGTLLVLEDNATNTGTIDNAGLGQFDISALNLEYAEDATLSLSEAQILSMSDTTDELTVHGGNDDTLSVSGAVATGQTRDIDGQTYDVYTVGDSGATLIVEQDINVII